MTSYDRPVTRALYLAVRARAEPTPFVPESDEEGAAASGALLGDAKCQISFTFDPKAEVFHAARRGCKGP